MSRSFDIQLKRPAGEFIQKAKSAVERAGGRFNGNENTGDIAVKTAMGSVKARYSIVGTTATIYIDDKPFLVTVGMIKSALGKYLK